MLGINDAENFKLAILNQREKVMKEKYQITTSVSSNNNSNNNDELLRDIKNVLVEIKEALKNK